MTSDADAMLTDAVLGWGDGARTIAGLAAIRILGGEIAYEYYSGQHEATAMAGVRGNGPDTLYRVASISKMVVAIGVMRLVEDGRIDLDADVSDLLGFRLRNPRFLDVPITARMLLSHTSTIHDADLYSLPPGRAISAFFDPVGEHWSDGAHFAGPVGTIGAGPGGQFAYANLNYGLLGTLIEAAAGRRFDCHMQDAVLAALGVEGSYNPRTLSDAGLADLTPLYRQVNGIWTAQVDDLAGIRPDDFVRVEAPDSARDAPSARVPLSSYEIGTNGTVFSPQGGLRISARGMAAIVRMLMGRGMAGSTRLLARGSVAEMERPVGTHAGARSGDPYHGLFQAYGLGVHTLLGRTVPGGGDIPFQGYAGGLRGHPGEAYGLLSGAYYDPDTGDGFVYMIGGTPAIGDNPGAYSSFSSWEEAVLTGLATVGS